MRKAIWSTAVTAAASLASTASAFGSHNTESRTVSSLMSPKTTRHHKLSNMVSDEAFF